MSIWICGRIDHFFWLWHYPKEYLINEHSHESIGLATKMENGNFQYAWLVFSLSIPLFRVNNICYIVSLKTMNSPVNLAGRTIYFFSYFTHSVDRQRNKTDKSSKNIWICKYFFNFLTFLIKGAVII